MLSSHKADNDIVAHRIPTLLYDANHFQLSFLLPKLSVHEEHCRNQHVIVSQAVPLGYSSLFSVLKKMMAQAKAPPCLAIGGLRHSHQPSPLYFLE
jgi:hypothetical protein